MKIAVCILGNQKLLFFERFTMKNSMCVTSMYIVHCTSNFMGSIFMPAQSWSKCSSGHICNFVQHKLLFSWSRLRRAGWSRATDGGSLKMQYCRAILGPFWCHFGDEFELHFLQSKKHYFRGYPGQECTWPILFKIPQAGVVDVLKVSLGYINNRNVNFEWHVLFQLII